MDPYLKVPTYDAATGIWDYTIFHTRDEFVTFLWSCWAEPGQYGFDETSFKFNEQARYFNSTGIYCASPFRSKDYIAYWNAQKERNTKGAIFKSNGKTWYLSRYYYFWLNFCRIYNKEKNAFTFADVRDAQYHMALYEELARHSYKHAGILKKRQIASSYFHAAVLLNDFYFEEGAVNKIAGSLKDYINEKGTWRFLEEYRNFLNEHTAWYRPCNPDKVLNWEQKIEVVSNGRKKDKGNKSTIIGLVLEKDPTNGVGGPCSKFFHEEAGIASQMNKTLEFLLPAMKSGMIYTGFFMVAGSVGDLDHCKPLKEIMEHPESKDVLAVETNLIDDKGTVGMRALFIPEQWSMQPCIDNFGNSLVEEALRMILEEREQWKKDLSPEDYQLRISQKPINIEEAFAHRTASKFPMHLVTAQQRRIENKEYRTEFMDIYRDINTGKPVLKETKKIPIREFPIRTKEIDKTGAIEIYEHPDPKAPWGTYYASVDPVGEGKTTTSESLCSIYIYKNPVEVTVHKSDGTIESRIERDKIVACWCGRFDDINKTHERLELLIEAYNAWTVVENNVSLFIQHMIARRKQKYLVPKSMIMFLREAGANTNVYQDYGWKNTGTLFKDHMLSYLIEFMKEEIDVETLPNGDIVKTTYGIERIPDVMAMVEAREYKDKVNVDRLVALTALVAFAKLQQSTSGFKKRVEHEDVKAVKPGLNREDLSKLKRDPFRNLGRSPVNSGSLDERYRRPARTGFRNLR